MNAMTHIDQEIDNRIHLAVQVLDPFITYKELRQRLLDFGIDQNTTADELCEEFVPRGSLKHILGMDRENPPPAFKVNQAIAALYGSRRIAKKMMLQNIQQKESTTLPPTANPSSPIMSYDELMAEVLAIPGIDLEIPVCDQGHGQPLQRMYMLAHEEALRRLPHIRRPCYIRSLMGNVDLVDLGNRYLLYQQVLDLSSWPFPARMILDSHCLRELVQNNVIGFVGKAEFDAYHKSLSESPKDNCLPVGDVEDAYNGLFQDDSNCVIKSTIIKRLPTMPATDIESGPIPEGSETIAVEKLLNSVTGKEEITPVSDTIAKTV